MYSPVMTFSLWQALLFVMPTLLVVLAIVIFTQRKRFNRKSYSRIEKLALLNIAILGPIVTFVFLLFLEGFLSFEKVTFIFPFTLFFFVYLYVLIIALGKKIEEVET